MENYSSATLPRYTGHYSETIALDGGDLEGQLRDVILKPDKASDPANPS
jgi:hypothetical protein